MLRRKRVLKHRSPEINNWYNLRVIFMLLFQYYFLFVLMYLFFLLKLSCRSGPTRRKV